MIRVCKAKLANVAQTLGLYYRHCKLSETASLKEKIQFKGAKKNHFSHSP